MSDCKHDGKKKTQVTKSATYLVCGNCGKRLKKLDSALIEKIARPEVLEKQWKSP